MKKVLIVLALLFISLTLSAQEEAGIRYYLQDGGVIEHKLGDIDNMSFIKSDDPYVMLIYMYGTKAYYELSEINSLFISNSKTLVLENAGSYKMIEISQIDSIVFMPATNFSLKLGAHSWMRKNLDVEFYRNGDPIPQVTDSAEWVNLKTGAWCYYNNDPANGKNYGKLYNWYAVNDPRGLAPEGWHIPSLEEWAKLSDTLGGDLIAGGKMKTTGTLDKNTGLWESPNEGATNESHFSGNPGGSRSNSFMNLGKTANYWSSAEEEIISGAFTRVLSYDKAAFGKSIGKTSAGFSVRCIEDYTTPNISSISPTSPQVGNVLKITGTDFGATKGESFVLFNSITPGYSDYLSWSDTQISVVVPSESVSGKVSVTVKGIKSNDVEFTISTIDPNYFEPVKIGDQEWMSRNLNVSHYKNGDTIPQVTDMEEWKNLKTGAWCYYNNDPKFETIYGKLYNWYAVNDPRGLAPSGWHVPREEEWTLLMDFLGGSNEAGGKMKQEGTSKDHTGLWKAPNWGATNESGFTALPAGCREDSGFGGIETATFWWSASEFDVDEAHTLFVLYMEPSVIRPSNKKYYGYSVRCIKD